MVSAPDEHPSFSIMLTIGVVMNSVSSAWERWAIILHWMRTVSITVESVLLTELSLGILFQSSLSIRICNLVKLDLIARLK